MHLLPILGVVAVRVTISAFDWFRKSFCQSAGTPRDEPADSGSSSSNESSGIPSFLHRFTSKFARCVARFRGAMYEWVAKWLGAGLLPLAPVKLQEVSSLSLLVTKTPCVIRAP